MRALISLRAVSFSSLAHGFDAGEAILDSGAGSGKHNGGEAFLVRGFEPLMHGIEADRFTGFVHRDHACVNRRGGRIAPGSQFAQAADQSSARFGVGGHAVRNQKRQQNGVRGSGWVGFRKRWRPFGAVGCHLAKMLQHKSRFDP